MQLDETAARKPTDYKENEGGNERTAEDGGGEWYPLSFYPVTVSQFDTMGTLPVNVSTVSLSPIGLELRGPRSLHR